MTDDTKAWGLMLIGGVAAWLLIAANIWALWGWDMLVRFFW